MKVAALIKKTVAQSRWRCDFAALLKAAHMKPAFLVKTVASTKMKAFLREIMQAARMEMIKMKAEAVEGWIGTVAVCGYWIPSTELDLLRRMRRLCLDPQRLKRRGLSDPWREKAMHQPKQLLLWQHFDALSAFPQVPWKNEQQAMHRSQELLIKSQNLFEKMYSVTETHFSLSQADFLWIMPLLPQHMHMVKRNLRGKHRQTTLLPKIYVTNTDSID